MVLHIQETAASAQESVEQIRLETKAMAEEQQLSLKAIEDSAATARMKVGSQSSKVHKLSFSQGGNDVGPKPRSSPTSISYKNNQCGHTNLKRKTWR